MQKRSFLSALAGLVAATLIPLSAVAQTAGKDYSVVSPPQPTEHAGKIEVLEFFSYGCIHCYTFHPAVKKWAEKLPADIDFKRIPVSFNRTPWFNLSRLFYALEAIGELNRLDELVFRAIHDNNVRLFDDATIKAWVAQNGVDAQKFAGAYDSFGVQSKAKRADQLAAAYKVSATPSLAVDGRYLVLNEGVSSHEEILARTDKVIGKARADKKK